MNGKILLIMLILIFTAFIGFFPYTLTIDFEKTKDNLNNFQNNSMVFIENPDSTALETEIKKLKKIDVEPNIPNSTKEEILSLLERLHSTEQTDVEKVKIQLIRRGQINLEERAFIIFHLLGKVENQDAQETWENPVKRNVWAASIDILTDLDAEEGIKYFVQGLDFKPWDKGSFHSSHAYRGVLKLKEKSVPSLIFALRFGRPEIKFGAADALAEIGNEMSKKALESALFTEQDKWVKNCIKQNLSYVKRKCEEHNYFNECSNHSWDF